MDVAGVEQRADLVHRSPRRAVWLSVEGDLATVDAIVADHASHRGALAGAVGPEEPRHLAGVYGEAEVVDGGHLPKRLVRLRISIIASGRRAEPLAAGCR
jgi:hypothetical protein